jgi:leader peptidase (prepilin peptidase)/N-methyltransferase
MSVTLLAKKHSLNAITAALFALAAWRVGFVPELPAILAFIFGGVLLAAIDWKVQRLPTRIIYYTLAGVGAGLVFASIIEHRWMPLLTAAGGGLLLSNAFCLVWLFTKKFAGMMIIGFGDVRLAALLGVVLGWYGLPYVIYGAIAGHVLAAVVAIGTCVRQRKLVMRYSFGPPLIAGALAVVLMHA